MASITIRNLDEDTKRRLRIRAAEHGRSMEEEAREVLRRAVAPANPQREESFWQVIRSVIEPLGGVELEIPERDPPRPLPRFEE